MKIDKIIGHFLGYVIVLCPIWIVLIVRYVTGSWFDAAMTGLFLMIGVIIFGAVLPDEKSRRKK